MASLLQVIVYKTVCPQI